ncbi:uncharacterized protein LOC142398548 [Odontesthes bonariensis]|uniref:uncharacterized protein LOC142398548 n=1 Tax=Odontesthes bonariensis TaxID=219752 RepID=UPI003F585C75
MSSVQHLREFISQRLTAAAEEIFSEFEKTIVQYEEEIDRQRGLLDISWKPQIKLHTAELSLQHVIAEENILSDQQLCNQEGNSSLEQKEPKLPQLKEEQEEAEPPQFKEEQEELCPSHEGEQFLIRQKTDFLMVNPANEESDHKNSEPNSNQLHSHNSALSVLKGQITEYTDVIKPYTCNALGKKVSHLSLLKCDKISHTGEKLYSCKICEKTFSLNSSLLRHMRTHTGEKPYSCKVCDKSFSQSGILLSHMTTHTGEKLYSCKLCKKRFSLSSSVLRHMRTHTGERPYPCKICEKRFSLSTSLLRHMRTHTGEKLYPCKICGKRFSVSSSLLRHMRTHTGERPLLSCKYILC